MAAPTAAVAFVDLVPSETRVTAVALTSVAAVLGAVLAPRPIRATRRWLLLATTVLVPSAALHAVGADLDRAMRSTLPMLLIVGYSAVAALLVRSGAAAALADRYAYDPFRLFVLAALLTLVSSNDTVVLVLGPIAVVSAHPVRAGVALFVGANVSAALLPQGSPTNLLVADVAGWSFVDYVGRLAPVALVMTVTAAVGVWLVTRSTLTAASPRPPLPQRERQVLVFAALTLFAQPLGDVLGVSRALVGVGLLVVTALAAAGFGRRPGEVVRDAAWVVLPVVAVVVAAASVVVEGLVALRGAAAMGVLLLFGVGFTDLTAAAAGAGLVEAGRLPGVVVIAIVTATAFASPTGSLSALLLARQFQVAGAARHLGRIFLAASAIALAASAVGLLVASA